MRSPYISKNQNQMLLYELADWFSVVISLWMSVVVDCGASFCVCYGIHSFKIRIKNVVCG